MHSICTICKYYCIPWLVQISKIHWWHPHPVLEFTDFQLPIHRIIILPQTLSPPPSLLSGIQELLWCEWVGVTNTGGYVTSFGDWWYQQFPNVYNYYMWVCSAVRKRFTAIPFAPQLFYTMQLLSIWSAIPAFFSSIITGTYMTAWASFIVHLSGFQDLTTGKTCYRCSVDVVPTSPVNIGPYLHYAALEAKVDHKILTFSIPYFGDYHGTLFHDALPVGGKKH